MTTTAPPRPATDAQVSADGPVQLLLPLKPPPGRCACGITLSVVNVDGVCDECATEAARKRRRVQAGVKFCKACGAEYFAAGYCHDHYRQYHNDAYQRRKVTA